MFINLLPGAVHTIFIHLLPGATHTMFIHLLTGATHNVCSFITWCCIVFVHLLPGVAHMVFIYLLPGGQCDRNFNYYKTTSITYHSQHDPGIICLTCETSKYSHPALLRPHNVDPSITWCYPHNI